MHVVVVGDDTEQKIIREKTGADHRVTCIADVCDSPRDADVIFYLKEEPGLLNVIDDLPRGIPVFVNAVNKTTPNLSAKAIRINGWPGFVGRDTLEIAAAEENTTEACNILGSLGWKYCLSPDIPGLIAPRIIASIVNEAYFTYGEGVASKTDIDLAMKLGTNYPYGPFEWAQIIGLQNIYSLLLVLAENDRAYEIAPALLKEMNNL